MKEYDIKNNPELKCMRCGKQAHGFINYYGAKIYTCRLCYKKAMSIFFH